MWMPSHGMRGHTWAHKYKKAPTGKTANDSLRSIIQAFIAPDVFMTDGGSHFDNKEVWDFCKSQGVKTHVVATYSPWINGLIENRNKLLLHILKRRCSPEHREDEEEDIEKLCQISGHSFWMKQ